MTDLVLCIVSTTLLFVIFKYFSRFKVENLQAITVNYAVASALGMLLSTEELDFTSVVRAPWLLGALGMGMCFIVTFSLIALSSQRVGVGITSVANKMSLVIPVIAGVVLMGESLGGWKLAGVILAVVAVVLTIWPQKEPQFDPKDLYLPVLIFFGSGTLDAILNYMRAHRVGEEDFALFTSMLFMAAFITGVVTVLIKRLRMRLEFSRTTIIAGIALGIPNYFSIYFLLKALDHPQLESTVVFPVVNTGIVLLSTLVAFFLFSERPSRVNLIGVALAAISIFMMSR